jgi:hypothetical protein
LKRFRLALDQRRRGDLDRYGERRATGPVQLN